MNNLDRLYRQSNGLLFNQDDSLNPALKDIIIARKNLVNSMVITDTKNTEFDRLIESLVLTLSKSNEVQALAIISKLNMALDEIANSFTTMLNLMNNVTKQ